MSPLYMYKFSTLKVKHFNKQQNKLIQSTCTRTYIYREATTCNTQIVIAHYTVILHVHCDGAGPQKFLYYCKCGWLSQISLHIRSLTCLAVYMKKCQTLDCPHNKDFVQTAHLQSLTEVFTGRTCIIEVVCWSASLIVRLTLVEINCPFSTDFMTESFESPKHMLHPKKSQLS